MALKVSNNQPNLMKAYTSPNFRSKAISTNSVFDYVELWLRRKKGQKYEEAQYYWSQAKAFCKASEMLPAEARPLTMYYSCMNAAKTLLALHDVPLENIGHGVTSSRVATTGNIVHDMITYNGGAPGTGSVLWNLSYLLGDPATKQTYCVYDLLYNLPCVHRAFCVSNSVTELFIPIFPHGFETDQHQRIYYSFEISSKYSYTIKYLTQFNKLPMKNGDNYVFHTKINSTYKWELHNKTQEERIERLQEYYKKNRLEFYFIKGIETKWYVKKVLPQNSHLIKRTPITISYGIMHWLSELVRYKPEAFRQLMKSKQNWVINEFLEVGLSQFIDEIASEITGSDISPLYK